MIYTIEDGLEQALNLANGLSGNGGYGGAAEVNVGWHPYESRWRACASWSNGMQHITMNDCPLEAVRKLVEALLDDSLVRPIKEGA